MTHFPFLFFGSTERQEQKKVRKNTLKLPLKVFFVSYKLLEKLLFVSYVYLGKQIIFKLENMLINWVIQVGTRDLLIIVYSCLKTLNSSMFFETGKVHT